MTGFQGVMFDIDGTLIDSNNAHAQAWVDALKEHGYDTPFDRVWHLIGMGGDNLLPEAANLNKDEEPGKTISTERSDIFKKRYLKQITVQPGTRALVQRMKDDGLRLIVATSAKEDELESLLKIADASDLLTEQTTSDDAANSKPDPDIVQVALEKMGLSPEEVVMIGDTPYDIQAANKAGVAVIALRCGGWDDEGLKGAIAIYDDPADMLAHYDELPLAKAGVDQ